MRSRLGIPCLLIVLICSMFGSYIAAFATQSDSDATAAESMAIRLSELESEGRAATLCSMLHPDAQSIIPNSAVVGWYENDFFPRRPHPITEITGVRFVEWTWNVTGETYPSTAEVSFIRPFGEIDQLTYQEDVVRLVAHNGRWRWFFGLSRAFVEEQITRYPESPSTTDRTSSSNMDNSKTTRVVRIRDQPTPRGPNEDMGNCTLVELYPGYPLYRGLVTGMISAWGGLGDHACLEDLERRDPAFDRNEQDQANMVAARELGLQGEPTDWTWENWAQIEAVRGLPVQCYSCHLLDPSTTPINTSLETDPMDSRIRLGFVDTTFAIENVAKAGGYNSYSSVTFFESDYALRATAYMSAGGQIPNAPQLLDLYAFVVDEINTPGGTHFSFDDCQRITFSQGGYTWVPETLSPPDQEFIMWGAWLPPLPFQADFVNETVYRELKRVVDQWHLSGYEMSLREYMTINLTLFGGSDRRDDLARSVRWLTSSLT